MSHLKVGDEKEERGVERRKRQTPCFKFLPRFSVYCRHELIKQNREMGEKIDKIR